MPALSRRILVLLAVALLPAALFTMVVPLAAQTTPPIACVQTYVVQQGDWLSTIARQAYGDSLAWPAIVDATNAAARSDATFTTITNPERIEVGQKLCLPVRAGTPPALPAAMVAAATPTATLLATPTVSLAPTAATTVTTVVAPTAAATSALTSTLPVTAAAPTTAPLSTSLVSYGGVAFQLDPRLAASAQGFTVPAVSPAELPLFAAAPAHVAFVFGDADDSLADLTALADARIPKLRVYPVADLRQLDPLIARGVDDLAELLATRPASITGAIPVFPVINAAQVFRVHIRYLDFVDGSGVRFITHYAQNANPVVAKTIFYVFQGLSADGKWYISAIWPLDATILPATTEIALGGQSYEAFLESFDRYLRQLISDLDALQPAEFAPDLTLLDAWIESLAIASSPTITPTAELTSSSPSDAAEASLAEARGTLRLRGVVAYGDLQAGAEIAATHSRPVIALVDQGGLYIGGDPSFAAPPAAQIYAAIEGDLAASPFTYTIDLPVAPRGEWQDVDQDDVREVGVQIFAISLFDDLSDLPTPHALTPLEQAHGGRLSSLLTALPPSPDLPPAPIGGALIVYAPDDQQGFPAGFGADGQLFTADDPITNLAAGWTVVTLDGAGFIFQRAPEVVVPLYEPSAGVPRDLSELDLVEAFNAMVSVLQERYPFTATLALDWSRWRAELAPQVEKAQAANDLAAWYAFVAQLVARLEDEEVTLVLPPLLAALEADQETTVAGFTASTSGARVPPVALLTGADGQRYGYLRVNTFDVTPSDVTLWQRALQQFAAARTPALILDLRGNAGGRALGAELLASHFFTAGRPLRLDGWIRRQFDPADGRWKTTGPLGHAAGLALAAPTPAVAFDGQVVVLVDEDCRGVCALVTAWLQRAGRVYVIGAKSAPSSDPQLLLASVASYGAIELPGGGRLTYPNAAELLADGQPITVQADLPVEGAAGEEDPALAAAISYLDERSAAEAPAVESVPIIVRVDYRCAAGRSLRVISTPASALVTFAGKARLLDRRVAASGERFADEEWEWWSKGEAGFLTEVSSGTMLAEGCVAQ